VPIEQDMRHAAGEICLIKASALVLPLACTS
jgi:hypothetical protein